MKQASVLPFLVYILVFLNPTTYSYKINNKYTSLSIKNDLHLRDNIKSLKTDDNSHDNTYMKDKEILISLTSIMIPFFFMDIVNADSTSTAISSFSNGIFASRIVSLIHPAANFAFFGTSLYSAYLGLQWRRLREINNELKLLNKLKVPNINNDSKLNSLEETNNEMKIIELNNIKKDLVSMNLKDKHYFTGSILLGGGITVAILGAFNTYIRTGEIYPGPHLYGGMAITILWAVAASLVPSMQKGNETARNIHISLNVINILLFTYQVITGFTEISYLFES